MKCEINLAGRCFQKQLDVGNKIYKNKLITKDHRVQNKWTENILKYRLNPWNIQIETKPGKVCTCSFCLS